MIARFEEDAVDMMEPFVALVVYPTGKDAQARQADNHARFASEKIRALPGFLRGRVFVSEDGESLVTLTEWSDRESFVQFRQSEFGQAAVKLATELHPQAYWLRQHAAIEAP
jgi:heme-degrading monooxygenase HmoA